MNIFIRRASFVIVPLLLSLQGCHVSGGSVAGTFNCALTGPTAGGCSIGGTGTVQFSPKVAISSAGVDDLMSTTDGSNTLSVSAPSSMYSADPNGTPATTISVTTDTGYTSSIEISLVPTSAAIAPVNTGDAVFSFNLPNTPQLAAWAQQVAANTTSSLTLSTSATLPLAAAAGTGSVTFTTVLTSNSVGNYTVGTLNLTRISSSKGNPGCKAGTVCTE